MTLDINQFVTDITKIDTGLGKLMKIAENVAQFNIALQDIDKFDQWLLASTVLDLRENEVVLEDNQVYSSILDKK